MKRTLQLVGFILAVLWVPIASHCAWENMPGLQIFQCASDARESSPASDCADDSCFAVETASYKISEPDHLLVPFCHFAVPVTSPELIVIKPSSPISTAPPAILIGWQFIYRTALPIRAPSLVS